MSSVDVALGIRNGQVVIHWKGARETIEFDPQNAFDLGEAMARSAHKAKFGEEPPSDRSYIADQVRARVTDQERVKMIHRTTNMLRSLNEQGKSPGYTAMQLVDTILAEFAR